MNIRNKIDEAIHQHRTEWYWPPHFIVLNNYTLMKLVAEIHSGEDLYMLQELEDKTQYRGFPILIYHGDYKKEIRIDTILDHKKLRE